MGARSFSGVTSSGRVWRKVPESEAWSVTRDLSVALTIPAFSSRPDITTVVDWA